MHKKCLRKRCSARTCAVIAPNHEAHKSERCGVAGGGRRCKLGGRISKALPRSHRKIQILSHALCISLDSFRAARVCKNVYNEAIAPMTIRKSRFPNRPSIARLSLSLLKFRLECGSRLGRIILGNLYPTPIDDVRFVTYAKNNIVQLLFNFRATSPIKPQYFYFLQLTFNYPTIFPPSTVS